MNKNSDSKCDQSGPRTTKFHCEKISLVQSAMRMKTFHSWLSNVLRGMSTDSRCTKKEHALWKMIKKSLFLFSQLTNLFWNKKIRIMLHSNENFWLISCFFLPYLCKINLSTKYPTTKEILVFEIYHSVGNTLYHYSLIDTEKKTGDPQLVRVHFSMMKSNDFCHC